MVLRPVVEFPFLIPARRTPADLSAPLVLRRHPEVSSLHCAIPFLNAVYEVVRLLMNSRMRANAFIRLAA
jgi:hypothetical protein